MDYVGERTTIENRLGRAGGLTAPRVPRLCQPVLPTFSLPILSRSAALLTLLLQDGTVDLELTSSVVGLDPGLAFGTLQVANLERNGDGEIWQFSLAVVAAGCDRLLGMVNCALKVESSYSCGTSAKLRNLYMRCVQRACMAEMLTSLLGNVNPRQSYVAGLLSGLPGMLSLAEATSCEFSSGLTPAAYRSLPTCIMMSSAGSLTGSPIAASVLLADGLLEVPGSEHPESAPQVQRLAASPLWQCWDGYSTHERCGILAQCGRLGMWVAANALRLSPWEFMTRLHRRKFWE